MNAAAEEETERRDAVADLFRRTAEPIPEHIRREAQRRLGPLPSQPEASELAVGSRLGPYRVEELLGRGGMSEIYRVSGPAGRHYALKVMAPGFQRDPEMRLRFEREVEALRQLSDLEGVARLRDAGTSHGHSFYVMDLVQGESLQEALKKGLPLTRGLEVLERVARIVAAAHERGLVHRDLKPGNVLLDQAGRVCVIDFGLVKGVAGEQPLTRTGDVLGTANYMAPEQALASPSEIGPQADVFSLGAILYRLLAGVSPYHGDSPEEVYDKICAQAEIPSPRTWGARVPRALEVVAARALALEPAQRYRDAGTFAAALADARAESARRDPLPLLGVAALLSALLLALLLWSSRAALTPSPEPAASASAADPSALDAPAEMPAWVRALDPPRRPPLPLPEGLAFSEVAGEVVNVRDGSVLVWVPAASFQMGSDSGEANEAPVHSRQVAGFYVGKHEVSWGQYARYCHQTGSTSPARAIDGYSISFTASDSHPVFHVSWEEARAYCAWAGLRLPREEEWELAARGSDGRSFPWGGELPSAGTPVANLADRSVAPFAGPDWGHYEHDYDDGHFFPAPVGSFPAGASPFGCLDMAGNVWEWVEDAFAPYPSPREAPDPSLRVVRGGSWDNSAPYNRSTRRGTLPQDRRANFVGFRVARDGRP